MDVNFIKDQTGNIFTSYGPTLTSKHILAFTRKMKMFKKIWQSASTERPRTLALSYLGKPIEMGCFRERVPSEWSLFSELRSY